MDEHRPFDGRMPTNAMIKGQVTELAKYVHVHFDMAVLTELGIHNYSCQCSERLK